MSWDLQIGGFLKQNSINYLGALHKMAVQSTCMNRVAILGNVPKTEMRYMKPRDKWKGFWQVKNDSRQESKFQFSKSYLFLKVAKCLD